MATLAAAALATPLLLASASPATADRHTPAERDAASAAKLAAKLVKKSSADDAFDHLEKFQQISDTTGNRAAGSLGYDASAAYVFKQLKKYGYNVSYQTFTFPYIETQAESLSVVSPTPRAVGVVAMDYTKSTPVGGITADLAAVPVDDTTGCEPADYASGTFTGKIALIKRGGCTFAQKQATAADAGAIGALVYNNVDGSMGGTLGDPAGVKIPTGGIVKAEGEKFATELASGPVRVTLDVRQLQETRTTRNVIAETKHGNAANTVMLGAHLDSVSEGAGINDNGSGSAGLLEVAEELAKAEKRPANKIRFAWWGAEENGLLGSEAYVASLSSLGKKEIKAYLNFDMIASPNYGIFLYDGDNSDGVGAGPGPEGSAQIERDMQKFLDKRNSPHEGTDFSGRSDYGPFIEVGIPAGGTFTGAEVPKTAAQAVKFGGTAGLAYDPNYHGAGDNLSNVSMKAFRINIGIIANAAGTYAHDISSLSKPVTPAAPSGGESGSGGLRSGHETVTE
ncbi:M20/M25/M40 family metallo-hydrolase [Streptomyces qinzhouensis]|uniref:M20/M25/M40 family metallo-hydrolase n=1 Tax=Streptomyces qinzhouensis TaxID=2599401 RepID=A0A5B8IR82_9ACTN|nr:M20/M25/M40 family metallo-hydrolase [Streptomyces qinzhouensis]QDY81062.1 M20/M25/M40 family metallo-hydrolase [Streptomyces qinzhouensis]